MDKLDNILFGNNGNLEKLLTIRDFQHVLVRKLVKLMEKSGIEIKEKDRQLINEALILMEEVIRDIAQKEGSLRNLYLN